jgi:dimethylaniline monooxygenase (N-oxide forming)
MAFAEMQSRVFFAVQAGECVLPSVEEMKRDTDLVEETVSKRYVQSPRHTIQVDYIPFMSELASMIGACPNPFDYIFSDFPLFLKLAFGPDLPYAYRLKGPFASPDARKYIMECEDRRIKATRKRDTGFPIGGCACISWPMWIGIIVIIAILFKLIF